MHHPTDTDTDTDTATDTGPAGLALPLALVAFLAERPPERGAAEQPRAAELRTAGNRGSRAARRRAMAVRG